MNQPFNVLGESLRSEPLHWLVTGGAGFIGHHLVRTLLDLGQRVRCVDDFSMGLHSNLEAVRALVGEDAYARFELMEGDLSEPGVAGAAVQGVDKVLHQAALGSVPRSIEQPLATHRANVEAFALLLDAIREAGLDRVVFASSSSVYGTSEKLPKHEDDIGEPISPYAASKAANEIWATGWCHAYGKIAVGLRYFNVFGPRQRPDGPYAAVMPKWIDRMASEQAPQMFGDGGTSRDFTPVELAVQANITAAMCARPAGFLACNVAPGGRMDLNTLEALLRKGVLAARPDLKIPPVEFQDERAGDVRHSQADVGRLAELLDGIPELDPEAAIRELCAASLSA